MKIFFLKKNALLSFPNFLILHWFPLIYKCLLGISCVQSLYKWLRTENEQVIGDCPDSPSPHPQPELLLRSKYKILSLCSRQKDLTKEALKENT